MEILVGVSLLRCRSIHGCLHSQIPNLQTQSWCACSMVWPPCCWSLPTLLQSCGFRQSFYGIIKLVTYNFQKLLHNHHPHSYRGMEPFCCTNFLDVCTQGRLPRISARKYISWEFPFCLKGFETKVTLSDLMSLQLGNLAQAYWLHRISWLGWTNVWFWKFYFGITMIDWSILVVRLHSYIESLTSFVLQFSPVCDT